VPLTVTEILRPVKFEAPQPPTASCVLKQNAPVVLKLPDWPPDLTFGHSPPPELLELELLLDDELDDELDELLLDDELDEEVDELLLDDELELDELELDDELLLDELELLLELDDVESPRQLGATKLPS
jgi:hypothetical protein